MPHPREPETHRGLPGTGRARRLTVAALLTAAAVTNLVWIAAPLVGATLDPAQTMVSELGARDQPGQWLFRAGDLMTGTLCATAAALAGPLLPPAAWLRIARWGLLVFGLCTAADTALPVDCAVTIDAACRAREAAGLVTWQHAMHSVTGTIESIAAVLTAIGLGLATRHATGWSGRSRAWLLAGLVLAAADILLVVQYFAQSPGIGVTQRIAITAWSLTLALAALAILATAAGGGTERQGQAAASGGTALRVALPEVPGAVVTIEVHNPAAPVVALFASGMGIPRQMWHPVLPGLIGITAVLVDRPGLGGSPPWPASPVDLVDQAGLIKGVLEHLRADGSVAAGARVVLVGHSYGGLLVEATARLTQDLAEALVLVDPSDPVAEAAAHRHRRVVALADRAVSRPGPARLLGALAAWAVRAVGTTRIDAAAMPAGAYECFETSEHLRGSLAELGRIAPEARQLLELQSATPRVPVPTDLLISRWGGFPLHGTQHRWIGRLQRRADVIGARTHLLDGAHLLMLDDPGAVAAAIQAAAHGQPTW